MFSHERRQKNSPGPMPPARRRCALFARGPVRNLAECQTSRLAGRRSSACRPTAVSAPRRESAKHTVHEKHDADGQPHPVPRPTPEWVSAAGQVISRTFRNKPLGIASSADCGKRYARPPPGRDRSGTRRDQPRPTDPDALATRPSARTRRLRRNPAETTLNPLDFGPKVGFGPRRTRRHRQMFDGRATWRQHQRRR